MAKFILLTLNADHPKQGIGAKRQAPCVRTWTPINYVVLRASATVLKIDAKCQRFPIDIIARVWWPACSGWRRRCKWSEPLDQNLHFPGSGCKR